MEPLQVVGKPAPRLDGAAIVTGAAHYVADLDFPGMLSGALLYPPMACARILHLDTSRARAVPGVVAVLTAADVPGVNSYLDRGLTGMNEVDQVVPSPSASQFDTGSRRSGAVLVVSKSR